jgi:peptidoglycan/xylan/chitin deacetylase (PgdA/CDA1 family)
MIQWRERLHDRNETDPRPTGRRSVMPSALPELGPVQKMMANCYFHLCLPALLRPLRERYRLTVSPSGGWPKLSLDKRKLPGARILYYHRVNNAHDPFFPAISTDLFEAEMRFVSKHYRVVSLAELVERLGGHDTEPVLAITFDDGYRDNYQNAFPILQRYGVPATIFLTTGSMDTGEALWFERLALAVKKTSRTFIDLDLPATSRLWLRTQAERLAANTHMFSALRSIPDSDRRALLKAVIKHLGVRDDAERDRQMLAWDDVRFMSAHHITFGGHTVSHPFLSRLSRDEFRWEVSECKRRVEEEVQRSAAYFAYPNGREEDFGLANKALVREAGYRAAVTTIWGVNTSSTDPFELRRGGPWEETAAAFAYKLDWYELTNG